MFDELARALEGEVVVTGSPAYEQRPRPFNARFDDVVPQAVVRCASADDVAETVCCEGRTFTKRPA